MVEENRNQEKLLQGLSEDDIEDPQPAQTKNERYAKVGRSRLSQGHE